MWEELQLTIIFIVGQLFSSCSAYKMSETGKKKICSLKPKNIQLTVTEEERNQ